MKNRMLLSVFVFLCTLGLAQATTSAAIIPGYYGANVSTTNWWCGVLGETQPGYTQEQCVDQTGPTEGAIRQNDAMVFLKTVCDVNDSNCLKSRTIQYMRDRLLGGGDTELQHTGASYIVNTMRGTNAGRAIYPGGTNGAVYDDWVARVNDTRITARIIPYQFTVNTAFDPVTSDVVMYEETVSSADVLMFYVNGSATYAIKLDCGNPVGNFSALPPLPPPILPPPTTPPAPVPATDQPTFKVNGGDVVAGSRFASGDPTNPDAVAQPCAAEDSVAKAGIATWNRNGIPDYAGAGTEYAAFARSLIQGFATNQGNGAPTSLSFANRGASAAPLADKYGGYFNESASCVDYWQDRPNPATATDIANGPSPNVSLSGKDGVFYHEGDITINPSNIGDGSRLTVYVRGNVYIKGDIKYGGGNNPSWTNVTRIPVFKLIVHGVIHIDSKVERLDGTYVAVPNAGYTTVTNSFANPQPGTISTCSDAGDSIVNPVDEVAKYSNECRRVLEINGSLAANQIFFLRTAGDVGAGHAEVINYGPEVWLAPLGGRAIGSDYQSIISLPPVL